MSYERPGSRREFFSGLRNKVVDRVHGQLREWTHSRIDPDKVVHKSSEVKLGKIPEFPANEVIPLEKFKIEIVSDYVGLKARDPISQECFALRLDSCGKIWMDRSQRWESDAVLCLMTGEKKFYDRS